MIPIEEYKKLLAEYGMTDAEVEQFRNSLYSLINKVLDNFYEGKTDNK